MRSKIIGGIIVLVALCLMGLIIKRHYAEKKVPYGFREQANVVTNQPTATTESQRQMAIESKRVQQAAIDEAKTKADIAVLQKQVSDLQKQLAAATNRQVTVVQQPSPIMQVVSRNDGNNSMILHAWTGEAATLHELNAGKKTAGAARKVANDSVEGTDVRSESPVKYTSFDLENAKEKELQIKDRIKDLREQIKDIDVSLVSTQNLLDTGHYPLDMRKSWRADMRTQKEKLVELREELNQKASELSTASADVIRISRTLVNHSRY